MAIPALWGLDSNPDGYGSISDFLNDIYGIDDNSGLTAFPVLNVPMGGRSEGLAGAFTAVADDASFLEWNPAGSSMLSHSELALFHNNWIADTKVEGAVFATRFSKVKNLGIAAGGKWLYTPFTEYNLYGERVSKGYYSEAVAILNTSYTFLSGYSFSGISVGMNLKGAFRFVPDYSDKETGFVQSGSGRSQSAGMVMADIGALSRFDLFKPYYSRERNASAALVIRNLGPPAKDDPLPTVATAAISYKPLRPLLLSFDFSVPMNLQDIHLSEKPYFSTGISVAITNFLSMRTGLMGKKGNVRIALGSALDLDRVSLDVNYTLDLLTQFTPLNRISLGVRFNLGDQGRKALSDKVDDLYLAGLNAYAQGNNREALEDWEEALRLDPTYDPAKKGIGILKGAQTVQDRIREMERLNY
jgi:tetratricopeptide (TPR) repeat protein